MTSTTCLIIALQNILRDAGKLFAAAQTAAAIRLFAAMDAIAADDANNKQITAQLYAELEAAECELRQIIARIQKGCGS